MEDVQLYNKYQEYNIINKCLHSVRYSNLKKLAKLLVKLKGGKKLKVLDLGSGSSRAYQILKECDLLESYEGVEIDENFVSFSIEKYGKNKDFKILNESAEKSIGKFSNYDLIIAFESFEHMPALMVHRIVESIGQSDCYCLYATVPNEIGPAVAIKNLGSWLIGYVRYKEYNLKETLNATCYNLDKVGRHQLGHKGFDWRWLAQVLRLNMVIMKRTKSPANLVPTLFSPSIGFICTPDKFLNVFLGYVERL